MMKKDQIKAVLDRVLTWPRERQEQAVRLLSEMEQQDNAALTLSDEQLAEVERRLADPNPKFLTLTEVRERFARRREGMSSFARRHTTTSIGSTPGSPKIDRALRNG